MLLFRVGDFYETFGEDAVKTSKILEIVLTSRNNGESKIELAGFPHHSLDTYLPKLIRAGERVAICDQLEDPKGAKGIVKNLFKKLPGKNMLAKLLGTVGIKGGLGTILKRFGGPIGSFVIALAMGEGIGEALAGTAGFAAGAALGQILIPIPILGGLIGGILGDMLLKKMFGFAKKFLGKLFGKKDKELEKNVKVTSGGVGMTSSEKTYTKAEIEALNSGASLDASGNVIPINKNENKATQISDVPEDKPEVITLPMGGATGGGQGVSAPAQKTSNALPTINFDTNNPHTLYATSVTGAGN